MTGSAPAGDSFYADLPWFTDFDDIVDLEDYVALPGDWVVLVSDVVGSTAAIAEGRYKDVNMLGAATITAILNACGETDLPYTFGGDGGMVIVPPQLADDARTALARLANNAPETFGLKLRANAIPVSELRRRGADLSVRKYELSPGNHLAMFAGDGLDMADVILKDETETAFAVSAPDDEPPDLEGLSCRWEPLETQSGVMMNVIVRPLADTNADRAKVLDEVLEALERILESPSVSVTPVTKASLKFRFPPRALWMEARATAGRAGTIPRYLRLLGESIIQGIAQVTGLKIGAYDPEKYLPELRTNTDFRKYDGHLRMVLDVSKLQADALEDHLATRHAAGELVHGIHRTDAALMTCLVFSLEQHEHVHFVDGDDGGYAFAARDLKRRVAAKASEGQAVA
ncbi:DUF3095 domain-containing protein [Tepidamorphus sp. 3E244]|uniref:DUF3095 domain-containing protein n=1 Tax=Tepidamorphus sp. 3E244 TaxID=3385498 RepID=UPI0038FCB5A4